LEGLMAERPAEGADGNGDVIVPLREESARLERMIEDP
jgi:hypothetical protein